jgi:hypothetical protein
MVPPSNRIEILTLDFMYIIVTISIVSYTSLGFLSEENTFYTVKAIMQIRQSQADKM